MDEMLTIKDVARILCMHRVTIQQMTIEGKIPAVKIGGRWRFKQEDIQKIKLEGLPEENKRG